MSLFSKEDLSIFLPEDHVEEEKEEKLDTFTIPLPKVDKSTRISRYRAGQVPKYASHVNDDDNDDDIVNAVKIKNKKNANILIETKKSSRAKYTAEIVKEAVPVQSTTTLFEESSSEEEEEEGLSRREAIRAKMMLQQSRNVQIKDEMEEDEMEMKEEVHERREMTKKIPAHHDEDDDVKLENEESSDEYETDTDDSEEEDEMEKMCKPVFVPKAKRETILKQEEREKQEQEKRLQQDQKVRNFKY